MVWSYIVCSSFQDRIDVTYVLHLTFKAQLSLH